MKKLFAILMCFQLIVSPVAFATDENIPGTEENDGSGVVNDAYKKTGNESKGGYDFYTSQIAMIAESALGSTILAQCLEGFKTPSISTFMAGSVVHIGSELLGAKAKNERNKKKIADLELKDADLVKKGDTNQLDSLKAFLQEEKDTRDFLRQRKNWMIAVDVIYAAAVGLAIAEEFTGLATGNTTATTACTTTATAMAASACAAANIPAGGIAAATAIATAAPMTVSVIPIVTLAATPVSVAAMVPVTGSAAAILLFPACELAIVGGAVPLCVSEFNAKMEATKAATPTHAQARAVIKGYCNKDTSCIAAAEATLGVNYAACSPPNPAVTGLRAIFPQALGLAYGFVAGSANTEGGMVTTVISLAVTLLGTYVVQAFNFPIPRSITFGALLVLSGVNTAGLAQRENISEANIKKIEDAIAKFVLTTDGTKDGVITDPKTDGSYLTIPKKPSNYLERLATGPRSCIGANMNMSPEACKNRLKIGRPRFNNGMNIPNLSNVANLSADMAQAMADGDHAKAAAISGKIGSMAASVKKTSEDLKAKYNAYLKLKGKPTIDFNKRINQQVAAIQGAVSKAAASQGMNLGSSGKSSLSESEVTKDTGVPVVNTASVGGVAQPVFDPLAGMGATEDLGLETAATKADPTLDDFESSVQDVARKDDVSIFKQLSNRYILNYTKIFDRKKEEIPVVPDAPKKE